MGRERRPKIFGENHQNTAGIITNLANLYTNQGKYSEAEPLYLRALAIREKVLGKIHPVVGESLNNLAILYREQGKPAAAEALYLRSTANAHCRQSGQSDPALAPGTGSP